MATLPPRADSSEDNAPKITRMGQMPVLVEDWDRKTNRVEGVNLRSGEQVSIRLANADEIADFYVNRNKHPTEEGRKRLANDQIANRPDLRTLNSKTQPGLEGQVVQMQGALKKADGEMIARWAKPVTADLELDVALRGEAEFVKVQTEKVDFRKMNFVQPRLAEPVTRQALDKSLQNMATDHRGEVAEGEVASRPLVVMQDRDGNMEAGFLYSPAVGKGQERMLLAGADGPDAAFQNIRMSQYNHRIMAATAGRVDIELSELKDFDKLSPEQQQVSSQIHDMARKGQLEIAIAPGFTANLLPNQQKAVMASENEPRGSGSLSGRGFYEADISLRTYRNDADSPVDARVKEVVETSYLHNPNSPSFVKRDKDAVAATAMQFARDNHGGLDQLSQPSPKGEQLLAADQEAKQQRSAQQAQAAGMAGPSI